MNQNYIIGAGMTGLGAGISSGFTVFEASSVPGGICSSYYVNQNGILHPKKDNVSDAYRFERGGGHWFFSNNFAVIRYLSGYSAFNFYERKAVVYLGKNFPVIPYPIQNNAALLCEELREKIECDKAFKGAKQNNFLFNEYLLNRFGETLCNLFFYPFHHKYTAGLFTSIEFQDEHKTPAKPDKNISKKSPIPNAGYNSTFAYPDKGLYDLVNKLSQRCNIEFDKELVSINTDSKEIYFSDGSVFKYKCLISTLPLNKMVQMVNLNITALHDPHTSVLVLNIGAVKHPGCIDAHWIYVPDSKSGFHRIGIYSNVNSNFLPSDIKQNEHVSLYVEKSFPSNEKPSAEYIEWYKTEVIDELIQMNLIQSVKVIHESWVDVAYTWKWPHSTWREESLQKLREKDIFQCGRFATWRFQGMAESFEMGYKLGKKLKSIYL